MKTKSPKARLFGASTILVTYSLLLLTRGFGATLVSGDVSGSWTTNQSPYILTADSTVRVGHTLSIEPGVNVIIGPDVTLLIHGGITAVGTPAQPIVIQGATPSNYWTSIFMSYSGFTNQFHYCRIHDGSQALVLSVDGGNRIMTVEILNCDFSNCRDSAIVGAALGYQATGPLGNPTGSATLMPEIHNCVFDDTGNGCFFTATYITYNTSDPPADAYVNPRIVGNIFKNLPTDSRAGKALLLDASWNSIASTNLSHPLFINNTVVNSYAGVSARVPNFDTVIKDNLFVNNLTAVYRLGGGTGGLDASYNCFFRNIKNFSGYPGIYGVPIVANHNGDPCDAFNNIFLDPRFIEENRFVVSSTSPCIDAGDPAIADVCFGFSKGTAISDIGAYGGPDACGWLNHGFAPIITADPQNQTGCIGGSASFKVRVDGPEPLNYRWYLNDTNLVTGETNALLSLIDLQTNQAGTYSVTVSNAFGSATSQPATLVVFDACVGIHLYAGLSITGLVGRTYSVEYVTNLAANNWTVLASNTFSQPQWLFIDTNTPLDPRRYFRVRLQP